MSYNKIMAYNVEYNWLIFQNSPYNIEEWWSLVLKEFSFFEVATNSSTEKYAIRHWEYVSPTQMKNRRIRLLFDIIANTESERRALLKTVQRAFAPEQNPSPFNSKLWKELSFLDIEMTQWKCNCQVLQWIQLSDFANQKRLWISVELITESPYFYSNQEYSLTTTNTLMWMKLPTKLPFKWSYHQKLVNIQYTGIVDSPVYVEITILDNDSSNYPNDNIKIIHQTETELETLYIENISELELAVWDIITVDSETRRCYLYHNETPTDISWFIAVWSDRPSLSLWKNFLSVDTGVWDNECITATLKWKNLF